MIARLLKSESLRSAAGFAAGGAGFAAGNILLARVMTPERFGVVALVLALNQFGLTFGPIGMEVVANRHRPRVGRRLALYSLGTAAVTGIIAAAIAALYYGLSPWIAALLMAMVVGSATNRVCVSLFQGDHRLRPAMALSQVSNYVLLLAAGLCIALSATSSEFVVSCMTASFLLSSALGWWVASRSVNGGRHEIRFDLALREGLAALGVGVGVQLLMQFERFAIPKVGSMPMLGTYAVLAAVAGSPFRMIQMGNSFTMLPRLRSVTSATAARAVILRETMTAAAVSVVSTIVILVAAPFVFQNLLQGKFKYEVELIVATIVVGIIKVWSGFATTVTTACGSSRLLLSISVLTWMCLMVAAAAVVFGSRYGLVGILYGVGAAWGVLAAAGTYLAIASFRSRFGTGSRSE